MSTLRTLTLAALMLVAAMPVRSLPDRWYNDPINPHLRNLSRVLEPSVLFDSSAQLFRLWTTDGYNLLQGISLDGRDWYYSEAAPQNLASMFDAKFVHAVEVVKTSSGYHLYCTVTPNIQGGMYIDLATSADGRIWTRHPTVPVITPGQSMTWPVTALAYPKVLRTSQGFLMAFGSGDGVRPGTGIATSADGISWELYEGNPVLHPGGPGSIDEGGTGCVALEQAKGRFYLLYEAIDGKGLTSIGLATSADGLSWGKSLENPAIPLGAQGAWNDGQLGGGAMRYANGAYHLWYCAQMSGGFTWQMGYASSSAANVMVSVPEGTSTAAGRLPQGLALEQNYPNPFNPSTLLTCRLPAAGRARLAVYDMLGREVAVLMDGVYGAGEHTVRWNASGMASGSYLCRLETDGGRGPVTRKVLLVR